MSLRIAIGADLGFTEKGDHAGAVALAEEIVPSSGITDEEGKPIVRQFVLRAERWRKRLPLVVAGLQSFAAMFPGAEIFSYVAGPEVGTLDLIAEPPYSLSVVRMPARYNKYVRAQRCAEKWSKGRILVPRDAPWDLTGFLSEVRGFTGEEGAEDDRVDALVSAHDGLELSAGGVLLPGFYGKRVM